MRKIVLKLKGSDAGSSPISHPDLALTPFFYAINAPRHLGIVSFSVSSKFVLQF